MIEVRMRFSSSRAGAGAPDLARCLLEKSGIGREKIAEKNEKGRFSLSVYVGSTRDARPVAGVMRSLKLKGVSFSLVPLRDSDWKTRWKKYVKPFMITPEIRVVPVWKQGTGPVKPGSILIDTTLAFGTGLHATTRMVAGLIRERSGQGRSPSRPFRLGRGIGDFLDVGTGSGILSVIACTYGAQKITAIDNDRQAVKVCRGNLSRNHCKGRVQGTGPYRHVHSCRVQVIDLGAFKPKQRFDFIAANLFTEELVRLKSRLVSLLCPGGELAVSGIYCDNYRSFRRRFKAKNIVCRKVLTQKKWYALLFQKTA